MSKKHLTRGMVRAATALHAMDFVVCRAAANEGFFSPCLVSHDLRSSRPSLLVELDYTSTHRCTIAFTRHFRRAIITDDWSGYATLAKRGFLHTAVAERGDMEVTETFLPIIHLVFSNLKSWLRGIHHGVSPQHLQAYLDEFTFRFNRCFYPFNAFRSLLGIAGDVTAPTYAELYSAKSKSRNTTSSRRV